jgi:quercetin dioxygenase-like cupin family protein
MTPMFRPAGTAVARVTRLVREQTLKRRATLRCASARGTPGSRAKLQQFEAEDRETVHVDTRSTAWLPGLVPGLEVLPLHSRGTEGTALVRWAPDTRFSRHSHWGGEEIFVLEGVFEDEHGTYPQGTWIRSPHGSVHTPFSLAGCTIWVKTGHLDEERLARWRN